MGEALEGEAPIVEASTSEAAAGGSKGRPSLMILLAETQRLMATGRLEDALAVAERLRGEAARRGEEDLVACGHLYLALTHHHMGSPRVGETPPVGAGPCDPGLAGRDCRPRPASRWRRARLGYSALNRWFLAIPTKRSRPAGRR